MAARVDSVSVVIGSLLVVDTEIDAKVVTELGAVDVLGETTDFSGPEILVGEPTVVLIEPV